MTANIPASRGLSYLRVESLRHAYAIALPGVTSAVRREVFGRFYFHEKKGVHPSQANYGLLPSLHPKRSLLSEKDSMNAVPKLLSKIPPNISLKSRFQTLMSPEPRRQQQQGLPAEVS